MVVRWGLLSAYADKAALIAWKVDDVTSFSPVDKYDVWHDRAVFHFLTRKSEREKYRDSLERSIKVGGYVIIAAFSIGGHRRCSGLDIVQYNAKNLESELGKKFTLMKEQADKYITPSGKEQSFGYYTFTRNA